MPSLRVLSLVCLGAVIGLGCGHKVTPVEDSGVPDAGKPKPPPFDAGQVLPPPDAGILFPASTAAEPCAPETFGQVDTDLDGGALLDAGDPDAGSVKFGICVALRKLTSINTLNAKPAVGPVDLRFESGGYFSESVQSPDAFGRLDTRVMKSRYDVLKYHPSGIFQTHLGFEEFGPIDLTRDQQRDLAVKSHVLRGGSTYATLPFISQTFPPDVSFDASGLPAEQTVSATSLGGGYEVSLLEGTFALFLSTPPAALGGTELLNYPLTNSIQFNADSLYDIDLPAHELEGQITIDGVAIPDRLPGTDYVLEFTTTGSQDPTVRTHHDGAVSDFHSLVPAGKYGVNLYLDKSPDRHYPSTVYNKQIAQQVDLTTDNQAISAAFITHVVEGGILVDGIPVRPSPSYNYTMYWYSFSGAVEPWSLSYYDIPLDSASFSLRAFPGNYYVMLNVDSNFAPDLAEGWYLVDKYFQVQANTTMAINIPTSLWQGRLLIDGVAPPVGQPAGEFHFRNRLGGFYTKQVTCAEDGSFQVRVPKGAYEVTFYIDRGTFPEYATGRQRVVSRLELDSNQTLDINYNTVLVTGPMRVGGEVVPDSTALEETGLLLHRTEDDRDFEWGFNGGRSNYRLRIPEGDYQLTYSIQKGVWPDVAYGTALMGISMPAHAIGATGGPPK